MSAKKAPDALQRVEGQKPESNRQEGNQTMTSVAPTPTPVEFDVTINVAGLTVAPHTSPEHDGAVVTVRTAKERLTFTPAQACAIAAALQAAAHLLMDEPRELHRSTGPGSPETDGIGGGL